MPGLLTETVLQKHFLLFDFRMGNAVPRAITGKVTYTGD